MVDIQPRVLVVDADAAMLTSVATVAEEEGFDVRTAVDVDGAMRQCRSAYIDLVFIDTRCDGTRADDVLSSIRIRASHDRNLPMIPLDARHKLSQELVALYEELQAA